MDTMVSKIYAHNTTGKKFLFVIKEIYKEIGFNGLWKGIS
jgi:hypothetical protein